MKSIFSIITLIFTAALILLYNQISRKKHPLAKPVKRIVFCAIISVSAYVLELLSTNEILTLFFHSVYCANMDFMLLALFFFVKEYSDQKLLIPSERGFLIALSCIDGVNVLLNTIFRHAFTAELSEFYGSTIYIFHSNTLAFNLHLIYTYLLVLSIFIILFRNLVQTSKFYRRRYLYLIVILFVVIVLDAIYVFANMRIDFSLVFYLFGALAIAHLSVVFIPKELINQTLLRVMNTMANPVVCFDVTKTCIYANDQAKKLFKVSGDSFEPISKFFNDEIRKNNGIPASHNWYSVLLVDSEIANFDVHYTELKDTNGEGLGYFFTMYNRTEDLNNFAREQYRANHDQLTKLYNQDFFISRVTQMIENDPVTKRLIVCCDIKDFMMITDLFGVEKSNDILRRLADLLQQYCRSGSIVARLEGDRFVMCIPKNRFNEQAFVDTVHEVNDLLSGEGFKVHIHTGVYEVTDPNQSVASMIACAMHAVSQVKNDYFNKLAWYDDELTKKTLRENRIINKLDENILNNRFFLLLDPQFSREKELLGCEAEICLREEDGTVVPHEELVPVLEQYGHIHRLDMHMWELACNVLKNWRDLGITDKYISIPVSARDFYYIDVESRLLEILDHYGLDQTMLKLSITETNLASAGTQPYEKSMDTIKRLQKMGFTVEINEFASRFSSFKVLMDLTADFICLTMSWPKDEESKRKSPIILDGFVDIANKMNITVAVKNVPTESKFQFLKEHGVSVFQGEYFSQPLTGEEFRKKYFSDL